MENFVRFQAIYMNSLSNVAVVNVYNVAEFNHILKEEQTNEKSIPRSIRLSSIITFVHHNSPIGNHDYGKRTPRLFQTRSISLRDFET
jgi:hypothetical protein